MSNDSNTSFAHAFIRDLLNERVPLGKIADHLQESFDSIHQTSQLAQVQQEFHAYQELCALRERLQRTAAVPLATAKLVRILELPEPQPTGHAARDERTRYQHAALMLRTIDKLECRTRTSSRTHRTTTSESSRAHADTPPPVATQVPPVPAQPAQVTSENEPVRVAPRPEANPIAASHAPEPTKAPSSPSEHERTQALPLPSESAGERGDEKPVPSVSGGTALQSDPPGDPNDITLQHSTITTHTDTPPHKPSLARAG